MAFIGLKHPVFAVLDTEGENTLPTYKPGMVVGRAMNVNIELNHSDSKLFADDVLAENDNGITSLGLTLGVDHLTDEGLVMMLGLKEVGSANAKELIETSKAGPYGGFGYIRVIKHKGIVSYVGFWIYKCQFGNNSEEATTRGEQVEWQTPTIQGTGMGVYIDDSGDAAFRTRQTFKTEAEAIAWVNGKAGIAA